MKSLAALAGRWVLHQRMDSTKSRLATMVIDILGEKPNSVFWEVPKNTGMCLLGARLVRASVDLLVRN